jgi:hypothetical protein
MRFSWRAVSVGSGATFGRRETQGTPLDHGDEGVSVHAAEWFRRLATLVDLTLSSASSGSAINFGAGDGVRRSGPRMICFPSRRRGGSKDEGRQDDQEDQYTGHEGRNAEQRSTTGGRGNG